MDAASQGASANQSEVPPDELRKPRLSRLTEGRELLVLGEIRGLGDKMQKGSSPCGHSEAPEGTRY